jgi:antitoxin component YwqK of YwqJK toxin-antitoxin module
LNSVKYIFGFLSIAAVLSSCSGGKLITVLVEDKTGNTELVYKKSQGPENLVKEVKYYPNGDTLSITPMDKGAVHGIVSRFHEGNRLKEQISFKDGTQDGLFRRYDKEGVLVFEGELKNGLKTGVWTTWYDDFQKQEERIYVDDLASGKWTYWYIDGSLKREELYKNGKLLEEKDF